MIAPLDQLTPETTRRSRRFRHARRLVALTFLKPHTHASSNPPPIPAWRAWTFALWVITCLLYTSDAADDYLTV